MLIVGGLLVIGVLALLGAVLLIRGEGKDASKKSAQAPANTKPEQPEAQPSAAPAQQPGMAVAKLEQNLTRFPESERESVLRGQVQELSSQLRSLHSQARDLEQHLGKLSATLEEATLRESDEQPTLVGMPAVQRTGTRSFKN